MIMKQGYIYVMINPSYDGIVNIGKTTNEPEQIAKELTIATAVSTPFIVVYKRLFNNCHLAESLIHNYLTEQGYRIKDTLDFFSIPINEAINLIVNLNDNDDIEYQEGQQISDNEDLKDTYYNRALDYEFGLNNEFIDYEKAIQYYQLAADLEHIKAYHCIGNIYEYDIKNEKKSIEYYKLSVERGFFLSYINLGRIYISSETYKNEHNQYTAWNNFIQTLQNISNDLKDLLYKDISEGLYDLIYYYHLYDKSIPYDWINTLISYKPGILDAAQNKFNRFYKKCYEETDEHIEEKFLEFIKTTIDFIESL